MSKTPIILRLLCLLNISLGLFTEPSLATRLNQSVVASPNPARYISQPHPSPTEAKNQSYGQIPGVYTPLPTQERGACSITDEYCSYNGTDRNPDGLSDQCILWDNTCSGNQTLAIDQFFSQTQGLLYENVCFTSDGDDSVESNCTQHNTPARYSEFARIKSWMRSPQCISSQGVYQKAPQLRIRRSCRVRNVPMISTIIARKGASMEGVLAAAPATSKLGMSTYTIGRLPMPTDLV